MLIQRLLLFVCMPTIKYILSVPTDERDEETKHSFGAFFRKQFNIPFFDLGNIKPKGKPENIYEPYWANGDWVYYRKESTKGPQAFFLNQGNTTQHDECNQICPRFVQDYGPVCGARYNMTNTEYDHRTFEDYCYLELENCYTIKKRLYWFPIKKGKCTDPMTTQLFANIFMATRAAIFEANADKMKVP